MMDAVRAKLILRFVVLALLCLCLPTVIHELIKYFGTDFFWRGDVMKRQVQGELRQLLPSIRLQAIGLVLAFIINYHHRRLMKAMLGRSSK